MEHEVINKVEILDTGELLLGLKDQRKPMYQYVYREAAGVYWDERRNGFKSTPMKERSCLQWYQHIIEIVCSGLGVELILGPNIIWRNISEDDTAEIQRERPGGTH
jgi:hypothetical protein